jgi:predicted DsbA family dithiol-disulfide isomerase
MMSNKIKIDIVSDIVCPWCYIGKKRLEEALEKLDAEVEVNWKPYQLHPQLPAGGMEREAFMTMKFGNNGKDFFKEISALAKSEGLEIDTDRIEHIPNTLKAHRLMWFASQQGKESELAQLLFISYFAKGEDPESDEILLKAAEKAGLNIDETAAFLQSDEGLEEVMEDEDLYRNSGISGVPSFVINNKYLIQGAQPAKVFLDTFKQMGLTPQKKSVAQARNR